MRERLQEALREAAAEFLSREASRQSLITVTRAQLAETGNRVNIYLTVLPESFEATALAFANRNRREFAKYFATKVRGARAPHVTFMIDRGEKSRQRLDDLTN